MLHVFKLGFAAFHVQEMQAMKKYYEDIAGFTLTETDENGSAYLITSTDHHNIVLIPSHRSGIHSFGFQYESEGSREEVIEHLRFLGI
jgi:catechol-2,3-dioxygenase